MASSPGCPSRADPSVYGMAIWWWLGCRYWGSNSGQGCPHTWRGCAKCCIAWSPRGRRSGVYRAGPASQDAVFLWETLRRPGAWSLNFKTLHVGCLYSRPSVFQCTGWASRKTWHRMPGEESFKKGNGKCQYDIAGVLKVRSPE